LYGRSLGFFASIIAMGGVVDAVGLRAAGNMATNECTLLLFCFPALECQERLELVFLIFFFEAFGDIQAGCGAMTIMLIYSEKK